MIMRTARLRPFVLLLTALAVLAVSTDAVAKRDKKEKKSKLYDCEKRFEKAMERYERGWHNDAATILEEVQFQCGGHHLVDSVLYFLGMAHLYADHPIDAKNQFRRIVDNYPNSPFYEEARFRLGYCTHVGSYSYDRDQTETRQAIRELSEFVMVFPESEWADSAKYYIDVCREKLAHKEFATARFYHRIDKLDAAAVYYRSVLDEYADSRYAPESRLYLAQTLAQTNRVTEAENVIDELIEGQYSEDIKRRARQLRLRLNEG
ncbi:MAG: outer membrane protein assembly factor BamD [Chitinivibrionales bacterium]|nr:outer membrane protein assembly factor BamD [Chitinivibrionales bacterium]